MNQLARITKELGRSLNRNSPTILTGLGISGFVTSIVMAVNATPKAIQLLEDFYNEAPDHIREEDITLRDKIGVTYQCYLPTAGMVVLSTGMIIMANRISLRRNAALASLYSITEGALREYQSKVTGKVGHKKEDLIRGEIAQDKLDKHPVEDNKITLTGKGEMLCFETLSGRYFMSDIETIRKAQNDYNEKLLSEMTMTLNELYYDIGLSHTGLGDKVGWNIDNGQLEFIFSAKIASNGHPCVVVDYRSMPQALWF